MSKIFKDTFLRLIRENRNFFLVDFFTTNLTESFSAGVVFVNELMISGYVLVRSPVATNLTGILHPNVNLSFVGLA